MNPLLSKITTDIKSSIKNFLRYISLIIFQMAGKNTFLSLKKDYSVLLSDSGILPEKKELYFKWHKYWSDSYQLWNDGFYLKSVNLRVEILNEIYNQNGVNQNGYFPPFYSSSYAGPIGHNACLGMHIAAQKLSLIPNGLRFLPIFLNQRTRPFYKEIEKEVRLIPFQKHTHFGEMPSLWHISERLQIVRTEEGFLDIYPLIEKIFDEVEIRREPSLFSLSSQYVEECVHKLEKKGLKKDDWFVTLHIRETSEKAETREQPIDSYFAAIEFIVRNGGKVLRIGDSSMTPLDNIQGVIDLSRDFNENSRLHLYALAKARFFIGTNSGPKFFPPLYGVPSLITNLTSIGIECLNVGPNCIYIPKKVLVKSKPVSYFQLLNTELAFQNLSRKKMSRLGVTLEPNTSNEILSGVKEIMQYTNMNSFIDNEDLNVRVKQIRSSVPYSSNGRFSNQWLEQNSTWFLQ